MNPFSECAAIIGIDWADRKHDLCLKVFGSDSLEFSVLEHKPEAIERWANDLRQRFGGKPVAICIESRKVPLIHALLKYDFLVLFPVNPQTLCRYRRALIPSRAKDDPSDARLLLELVLRHPDQFAAWKPQSASMRTLAQLVEYRRTLVADRVRIINRMTAALKLFFPQVLDWFEDKATLVFCEFLEKWPTLADAKRARKSTLERFFHAHNSRYPAVIARRIDAIKASVPLTEDAGVIEPNRLLVVSLAHQLALVMGQIRLFDEKIRQCFERLEDADLFRDLPGAGPQLAPRLLVAFGEDRKRFSSANALCCYAGIAPVTERSGNKSWVHWRYSCPKFLRQSFIEWTNQTVRFSFWARAFYQVQREKGKTHQMAIRALAYKWIRILWRCWQDRKPYDEARYLLALKEKGSPLVKELAK
jgi:transposase